MSEAFVSGAVPLRWEFDSILNTFAAAAMDSPPMRAVERAKRYAAARAEVCRAFDAQAARIAELEALVRDLRDPSPCDHFDHHGHCQTHGWTETDPTCPHGRAAKLFAAGSVAP